MTSTDVYENYRAAGRISREALELGADAIKEGVRYREIVERVEHHIHESGASLAFPVNIAVNSVAAHFTPSVHDDLAFKRGDVVKLDVGAHVDGYIGDNAKTVEVGTTRHAKLMEAAEQALGAAIRTVRAGVTVGEIGRVIEDQIRKYGFEPIRNLQGHSLEQYRLHAGLSIPNFHTKNNTKLKSGQVIAIEPFVTDGEGYVTDAGLSNIYRVAKKSVMTRQLYNAFRNLPFAESWMYWLYGEETYRKLSFLMKRRMITPYFKLVEVKGGIVAQAEHTVYVTDDGCEILTLTE